MTRNTRQIVRQRGAAMMELVLVLPLVVVILAMLFYVGRMEVRAQRAVVMARYEAWRAAAGAPGPYRDDDHGNSLLNHAFFASHATNISSEYFGGEIDGWEGRSPSDAAERFVEAGESFSDDAGLLAEAYIWQPGRVNDAERNSSGVNRAFRVRHEDDRDDWIRIGNVWKRDAYDFEADNPGNQETIRRNYRLGTDWDYTSNWRASAPMWANVGGTGERNHVRAVRDAFYEDFDAFMDDIDGTADAEYSTDPTQVPAANFSGAVRGLYLETIGYVGPNLVHRSRYSHGPNYQP